MQTIPIGRYGEAIAAEYLQNLGYTLKGRNVRIGRDEIDLLLYDPEDQVMVFAEVKTRSRKHADFHALRNITFQKKACALRAAQAWVAKEEYEGGYRIDVVCVEGGRVTLHWKDVGNS